MNADRLANAPPPTLRSNFSDLGRAIASISCDVNSEIAYAVRSAANREVPLGNAAVHKLTTPRRPNCSQA